MDTRLADFEEIKIQKYVMELDLLASPILNAKEKEFLAKFYDFLERDLDKDLRALEELDYYVEEPTQDKKREIVIRIMKKLAENGYYSTILNEDEYEKICKKALEIGMPVAVYCRFLLLKSEVNVRYEEQ